MNSLKSNPSNDTFRSDHFVADDILFRVYDPATNTMYDDCLVQFHFKGGKARIGAFPVTRWEDDVAVEFGETITGNVLRFSGMLDRHKTRIYQGDVLRLVDAKGQTIKAVCQFGRAQRLLATWDTIQPTTRSVHVNEVDIMGFYFERLDNKNKTFPVCCNYKSLSDLQIIEVVGNIFQHKHLLIINEE